MNFNSPNFILFIFFVVSVNYFLSPQYRKPFLLATSFYFVGHYNIESLYTLIALSFFNFYLAKNVKESRFLFILGVIVNALSILFANYIGTSHKGVGYQLLNNETAFENTIILIGVAFYSLQNIAYLTDIYFKRIIPESSIVNYFLSVSFFPKIISGPVVLVNEFTPQLNINKVSGENLTSGFNRFLMGLVKKMVIADRLSPAVHSIFDYSDNYHGLTTLFAIYLFTVQLYFDFSGYTDMALGIAKMLGFDLNENFHLPFRSTSVSEFWRRWHMSLMNWLTTYIYYPVAYRLRKLKRNTVFIGVALIFITSSIWRGISVPFLVWAICHITYISFEVITKKFRNRLSEKVDGKTYKLFSAFVVFNAISISNLFFRASSMENAFRLLHNATTNFIPSYWLGEFVAPLAIGGHQIEQFNFIVTLSLPLLFLLFEKRVNEIAMRAKFSMIYIMACIMMIMLFGIFHGGAHFIYMQY